MSQAATSRPADGRRRQWTPLRVLGTLVLTALAVTTVYPLVFLVLNAMKTQREYVESPYGLPGSLDLSNLDEFLFAEQGWRNVFNSVVLIGISVPVCVALATLAAYAFTKRPVPRQPDDLRRHGAAGAGAVAGAADPAVPDLQRPGLIGSYWSLFLAYVSLNLPFGIFLLASTMRSVPNELLEAARIDGAGNLRTLLSIVVPSAKAGIMTFALLAFQTMWNELALSLLLIPRDQDRLLTPTVALLQGRFSTNEPLLMAGLLVATVPSMLAVAIFARYLERGALAGIGK